jgi:cob(I)alamin adenosyltransferase
MSRSRLDSQVATGKGDDGSTGLLFGGDRIQKDDLRAEAFGTIDEAVAALGLARAELGVKEQQGSLNSGLAGLAELILRFQRELFAAAAELATNPDAWDRQVDGQTRVSAAMLESVESVLLEMEGHITMPSEFVVPGETRTSAALEQARTILRRAERRVVTLGRDGLIPGEHLLPYLNRLADLLWVLARAAEQAEARAATPSRIDARTRPLSTTRVAGTTEPSTAGAAGTLPRSENA